MASNYDAIREENIREYGEGTRHLEFLGRLYSDRTHFVYELLQNAEDANATRIEFSLYRDRLELLHDGKPFDEADVRGICGIGRGTKPGDLTKIGKFGIGFKSVYAYTTSLRIHCEGEHFRIAHYVRPHGIEPVDVGQPWTTRFVFPFDSEEISAESAYTKISDRLTSLDVRTLLFLRMIDEIQWTTDEGNSGTYLRDTKPLGPARHVTVIGQKQGESDEEESWVVFERPVDSPNGSPIRPVEIAYRTKAGEAGRGKTTETITPLHESLLFVFFATEKDTRLGFLAQGPYKTTPARDNIPKDDEWNAYLVEETGYLVADSLHHLKVKGLLDVSVLQAMPVREEDFPSKGMFRPIYDAVARALTEGEYLPAEGGDHLSAREARIGRGAEIRALLSSIQLTELFGPVTGETGPTTLELRWLSDTITQDRTPELRRYLIDQLGIDEITPEVFASSVDKDFFQRQEDDWFLALYRFLLKQEALWRAARFPSEYDGPIRHKAFIRLEDGSQVSAFDSDGSVAVYLPGAAGRGLPYVKRDFLADEDAQEFFKRLKVREPDIISEVVEHILPIYESDEIDVSEEEHLEHISQIVRALRVDSETRRRTLIEKLQNTYFLSAKNAKDGKEAYARPQQTYLETPEMVIFLGENPNAWFLGDIYPETDIYILVEKLGVRNGLHIEKEEEGWRGFVTVRAEHGRHERGVDGFDPRCRVEHLDFAVSHPTIERSLYIWRNVTMPLYRQIRGTVEQSTRQTYEESKSEIVFSDCGDDLVSQAWIPDVNGEFHKPEDLSLQDLPDDFAADERVASQLGMKGSELTDLATKVGLPVVELELLRELKNIPGGYRKFQVWMESQRSKPNFPERRSNNPDRRSRRARARAGEATRKRYAKRKRSVRTSGGAVDKVTYLRESYTNGDSELLCQICEEVMPFRRRDDAYYFEAVQLFDDLASEHAAAHLALCPLCAAKFKELVKKCEGEQTRLRQYIVEADDSFVALDLGGEPGSIRFVETHLLDIQGVLAEEDDQLNREGN